MQEREKTRCKSDMAYHCATHDTQWLDDESDRCEYKRMVDAEAAIARVRKWHAEHCDECNDTGPCPTIRANEGELT